MRRLLGCVLALVSSSCVSSEAVPCGTSGTCAPGSTCATVKDLDEQDHAFCALPEQLDQCASAPDRAACTLTAGGTRAGTCHGGVCLADECGNRMLDSTEVCDDGNTGAGDGCSDDCKSNETCGNGILDPLRIVGGVSQLAEVCDDHGFLAHDGCSPACGLEAPHWSQILYGIPGGRTSHAMAWDSTHGYALMFAGLSGTTAVTGETWDWNGRAWALHTVEFSPIPRVGTAMADDASRHRLLMFGGRDGSNSVLGDTWVWDGRNWTLLAGTPGGPPARTNHAMAYDSARKRVVMYGGEVTNTPSPTTMSDTWEWDGTMWKAGPAAGPGALTGHAMAYDPKHGQIVLFGGRTPAVSNETWVYDGTAWSKLTPAMSPPAREAAGMAWDPVTERVLLYGGVNAGTFYTDTWTWDGTTWTQPPSAGTPPGVAGLTLTSDPVRKTVVMFGGASATTTASSQLWIWNGTGWAQAPADLPPRPDGPAVALDTDRKRVVSFSGTDINKGMTTDTNDLAENRWVKRALTPGPVGRINGGLAYDQAHHEMVLFGGSDGSQPLADGTWTLDTTGWHPRAGAQPPARTAHRIVYDANAGETVLFGGIGTNGLPRNDTWTWNGTAWMQRTTPAMLVARSSPALGYDPVRKAVVLFGGQAAGATQALGDVWEWSGGQWTQKQPTLVPPARTNAMFAWDPARKVLVLGAGLNGNQDVRDVWEWNGTAWTRVEAASPPPRVGAVLVTNPDGAGVIVVGGHSKLGTDNDSFALRWDSGLLDDACTGTSDLDGDGLRGCADPDCWASCGTCGNGTCDPLETCTSCPADCTCPALCGDLVCAGGETKASCPGDCP